MNQSFNQSQVVISTNNEVKAIAIKCNVLLLSNKPWRMCTPKAHETTHPRAGVHDVLVIMMKLPVTFSP